MISENKPWDKNLQLLLCFIVSLNLLPHASDVPYWITACSFLFVLWKVLHLTRGLPLPKKWMVALTALIGTGGVFFSYQTIFGQEAAGGLLVLMASLKVLETNRYRDAMLVIFTSYFLLMSHLLASQSLASTVFMVIDVLAITALMFQVHRRDRKTTTKVLRPTLTLLGLALPLWVFLFFLFPRFSIGLWNVKNPEAGTGFSENMDPGSISRLVDSEDTAFRVQFNFGEMPSAENLYWRGAILPVGDGLKWTKATSKLGGDMVVPSTIERKSVDYRVYIEPGFQKWIFTLDYPISFRSTDQFLFSSVSRQAGFVFQSTRDLFSRTTYEVRSVSKAPTEVMTPTRTKMYLTLPSKLPARVLELAKKIKSSVDLKIPDPRSAEERWAKAAAGWFVDAGFRYSKNPGPLTANEGVDQLAEFLFSKRIGFCEHYAGAFSTLVRAMGIPARVVVGFQGGVANDLGGYWIVRKLDAHAWAEIWVQDPESPSRGQWVRMDPTELIAPLRLQLGGDYYKVDNSALSPGITGEELRQRLRGGLAGLLRRAAYAWDAVQMKWNAFLLNYDLDAQIEFLRSLGFNGSAYLGMIAILLTGLAFFAAVFVWTLRRKAHRVDSLVKDWRLFCSKLEKIGTARSSFEGPLDFGRRAAQNHPDYEGEILAIASRFAELRYGSGPSDDAQLDDFHHSVLRFSIRPNSSSTAS